MFSDGDQLRDETLLVVAADNGLNKEEVSSYINDKNVLAGIVEKAAQWSSQGITGRIAAIHINMFY